MNPELLLSYYERIADAPDAVAQLRRLILDLAVRGKLVTQDPDDEPASELLKRIAQEKARLVKAGEIKKNKPLPEVDVDEIPFTLPTTWVWTRIRNITSDRGQTTPHQDFTYIDVSSINKELGLIGEANVIKAEHAPSRARKIVKQGDVIYSCVRPYLLNVAIIQYEIDPSPIASTAFAVLNGFGLTHPQYQWIVLRSPFMIAEVEAKMRGQAYPAINDADFAVLPFPLPPLAEQQRIVARVDELMALCDALQAAREQSEKRRATFSAASLARLSAPNEDDSAFREDAAFALEQFDALSATAAQLTALRQTILNLAVRGKLVPQDPDVEPASVLLERIAREKARLVKAGEIKRDKPLPEVDVDEIPFTLPPTWVWTRIRNITSDRGQITPHQDFTYIDVSSINKELGLIGEANVIKAEHAPSRARKIVKQGDVIYSCVRPYLLNVAIIQYEIDPSPIASTAFAVLNGFGLTHPQYQWIVLRSPFMIAEVEAKMRGQAYPAINDADFAVLPFPLPPLAEQQRIVAKVDELMALCDALEASLAKGEEVQRKFLDSVLHAVLQPTEAVAI